MARMQTPCFHLRNKKTCFVSTTFKTSSVYLCSRSSVSIQPSEAVRKYERKMKLVSKASIVENVNTKGSFTGAVAR